MSLSQRSSNHSSMNGGDFMGYLDSVPAGLHLSAENATPKPLRINKQRTQAVPAANSENSGFVVPRRKSSISGSRTTAEFQRADSTASSSQCSNDTLNVHKRGQTKLSNSCSNKSIQQASFRSRNAMAQFHGLSETWDRGQTAEFSKASRGFEDSGAHFNNDKAPMRSVTTGSIIPTSLLSPFTEGPLIPLAPTPIATKYRRRAATTQGPKPSLTAYQQVDQSANQDVKRQSSLKKRLISRVMSGLSSKQAGSDSTKDCQGSVQQRYEGTTRDISDTNTRESSVETTEDYSNGSTQRSSNGTTQESSNGVFSWRHDSMASSFDASSSIWGSELVQNLAGFPNPPTLTSAHTFSSMGTTLDGAEISENCSPSSYIAIPGVEISAVPEISSLNSEDGESVFVAVELTGILNQPEDGGNITAFHHALEVAVVIDNSLFTSPAALMASCEIARHLAALLVMSDDKLAILSTSPLYPNLPQSRTVQPLNTVDTRRVKLAVDSITGSTEQPDHEVTIDALECAKNILKRSQATMANKSGRISFGHIFLLTTNPAGIPSSLLHDEILQIHLINPGTVPWKGQKNVECNGWKLRSLYRSEFEFVSLKKDEDETSLFNRLRNVITHARSGKISGKLTDLVLELNAGNDCSIEAVMGKASYLSLQPGEVILALVKVSIGQIVYPPLPSSSSESLDSPSNSCALMDELKSILKASSTTLLTAKLEYKYSLFPSKTRCSIIADCNEEREAPGVGGDKNILIGTPQQGSPSQILVQKRLVFYLATHHSPRRAISSILDYFGADGRDSVCPNYVKLVLEELKYQARTLERLDPSDVFWITAGDGENLCEHFGHGLFDIPNFKPQEWLPPITTCKAGGGLKEPVSQTENKWNTSQTLAQGEVVIRQGSGKYLLALSEKEQGDDNGSERSTEFGSLSKYSLSVRLPTRLSNHRVEAVSDEISRYSPEHLDFSQKSTSSEPRTVFRERRAKQKSSSKPRKTSQKTASELRTVSSNARMNKSDKADEAHNIWDQMKKLSRSNSHRSQKGDLRHPIRRAANSPQVIIVSKERAEQERTRVFKQLAIKNQRSVGEETLRSFGRGGAQRKDRRAIGPWAV